MNLIRLTIWMYSFKSDTFFYNDGFKKTSGSCLYKERDNKNHFVTGKILVLKVMFIEKEEKDHFNWRITNCVCVCLCIYISWRPSDLKAPFSIATTLRCKGGFYSFPWIASFYPRYISYNAEY